ncbi:nucleotide-binding universal stress UspA family protein [Actinoplanes tereljensis]|uniref:Universal stress protein n=1 Tax=Paractinoplanes tereljensis TaxID=571912 RepID=A0A919TWY5_9ACTN|nr:universal stress protein [Actinoplanes tereljensis]GIF23362.1 universal stress protein [Actinoplanes tereljensis]
MEIYEGAPVVIGIDGSPDTPEVVRVATREAALRHRNLRLVRCVSWPPMGWSTAAGPALRSRRESRSLAGKDLAEAAGLARRLVPEAGVVSEIVDGSPAAQLLAVADGAVMLLVGGRSANTELITRCACPLIVVHGHQDPYGPVVVGVDGSPGCASALDFAAQEACLRNVELIALHTWTGSDGTELNAGLPVSRQFGSGEEEQQRVLAEALGGIAVHFPDLAVQRVVRRGSARRQLLELSYSAQLVVVGGLLPGWVSRQLLLRAGCPAAVVHPAHALGA